MALWFHQIEQGSLSTELLDLRLENERFGSFAGQGFLKWSPSTGVEISALTNGGQTLSSDFFGHRQLPLGSLIPPACYLRLSATTRDGTSIDIERLHFDGYDAYHTNETVVWTLGESHLASTVTFAKGTVAEQVEYVTLLLSNAHRLVWPRASPGTLGCLQVEAAIGKVTAFGLPNGNALVNVEAREKQQLKRIVNCVSYSLCFWAGKILPVVAYDAHVGDSSMCRLYPSQDLSTPMETPPFGHTISLSLIEHNEALVQKAIDFFANDDGEKLGQLVQTRLSCSNAPFSVGILILCSALEGIAKELVGETGVSEEVSAVQCKAVESSFQSAGLPAGMVKRFLTYVSKVNAPTVANAISHWCKTGYLGFSQQDWEAWDYRNKSAHGNFSLLGELFEERKLAVARRDRLGNMINKLVMHAIGYRGKYLDYATYREEEFPPVQAEHNRRDAETE